MKRAFFIFVFCLLLSLPTGVFGTNHVALFLTNWMNIYLNEDPTKLPEVTITDNAGGNITPANGISILLPKDIAVLWDKTVAQVKVDGILKDVIYAADQRSVKISVGTAFTAGQQMKINGLVLRIYDQGTTYQNFSLDVNGDLIADVTGVNGFQIDESTRRTDRTSPFEVTDLGSSYTGGKIVLSWKKPLDYDYNGILMTRKRTRAGILEETSVKISRNDAQYEDINVLVDDLVEYRLKSVDYNDNASTGLILAVTVGATVAAQSGAGTTTPAVGTTTPADNAPGTSTPPSQTSQYVPLIERVSESDIQDAIARYKGISVNTPYLKHIIYGVKNNWFTPTRNGDLRLTRTVKYRDFASVVGPIFGIEAVGSGRNAYFKALQSAGFFDEKARPARIIKEDIAFLTLMNLGELDYSLQSVVSTGDTLRKSLKRDKFAYWLVELRNLKEAAAD